MEYPFSAVPDQRVRDHHVFFRMIIVAAVVAALIGGIFIWMKLSEPSPATSIPEASNKKPVDAKRVAEIRAQKAVAAALAKSTPSPATPADTKAVAAALAKSNTSAMVTSSSSKASQAAAQAAAQQQVSNVLKGR